MAEKYIIKCTNNFYVVKYISYTKIYKGVIKSWKYADEFSPELAHKFNFKQAAENITKQLNLIKLGVCTYQVVPYLKPRYYTKKQIDNLCY